MLAPGGKKHKRVVEHADLAECGAWRQHVLYNIARRDGDEATIAACEAEQAELRAALRIAGAAIAR